MNWQAALRNYAVTNGNLLSISQEVDKNTFNDIKRSLQVFRAKWVGGNTQAFQLALNASQCLEFLLSVSSMPRVNPLSYHPTPAPIKHWVFEESYANPNMWFHFDRPVDILEPSAGECSLCDSIKDAFEQAGKPFNLTAIELDEINYISLKAKGYCPIQADFLKFTSEKKYDLVIVNPPFDRLAFLKHIRHAQSMLRPGGKLVAIVPTHPINTNQSELMITFREEIALTLCEPFVFDAGTFETAPTTETRMIELHHADDMTKLITSSLKQYSAHNFEITYMNETCVRSKLDKLVSNGKLATLEQVENLLKPVQKSFHDINAYLPEAWFKEFCQIALKNLNPATLNSSSDEISILQVIDSHSIIRNITNSELEIHLNDQSPASIQDKLKCSDFTCVDSVWFAENCDANLVFARELLKPPSPVIFMNQS